MAKSAPLDPEKLIKILARHRVRFVLIGALAARLQGFPRLTAAADITPARDLENLERLAAALRELKARVFTEAVPEGLAFDCRAQTLNEPRCGISLRWQAGSIWHSCRPEPQVTRI